MIIEFGSVKLAESCADERRALKIWGKERARKIFQRLQELAAIRTLGEYMRCFPGAKCHRLKGDRAAQYALSLNQPFRMIFEPCKVEPEKMEGEVYENRITGARILKVENYHG